MRRVFFLAIALLFPLPSLAHAQILSVYGTYSPLRASNVATGSVYTAGTGYQEQYSSFWANGFGGGVTLNFLPLPVVSLGFDVRGSSKPGTVGADTAMVGLKLGVHPPLIRVKPYIQGSAGYVAMRTYNTTPGYTAATFTNKDAAWEILGGIDYPLMHFVDFRVIEVGGGKVILDNVNNASLLTINTGLVVHF